MPQWEKLAFQKRNSPGAIAHHTMTVHSDKAFLIGGSCLDVDSSKDYFLDLFTLTWSVLSRNDESAPISIDEHTANLLGDEIIIFGGNVAGFKSNQIYCFNANTHRWSTKDSMNEGPCPRAAHSTVIHNNRLVVFGGKDQDGNKLNDLWEFNLEKVTFA